MVSKYREVGLIAPVGTALTNAGVSAFYHPRQVRQLRRRLGITLENTEGLLNEKQFMRASGLSAVAKYRNNGLLKPVGWAMTRGGRVGPYYGPSQIRQLRLRLGITLESTQGLLAEPQVAQVAGLKSIATHRKQGLIRPAGFAICVSKLSAFYRPSQIVALKKKLASRRKKRGARKKR